MRGYMIKIFKNFLSIFTLLILLTTPSLVHSGWFFISNQEECVNKYLKKTKCNYAARLTIDACYNLFNNEKLNELDKEYYKCIIEEAAPMENEFAVKYKIGDCLGQHSEKLKK